MHVSNFCFFSSKVNSCGALRLFLSFFNISIKILYFFLYLKFSFVFYLFLFFFYKKSFNLVSFDEKEAVEDYVCNLYDYLSS